MWHSKISLSCTNRNHEKSANDKRYFKSLNVGTVDYASCRKPLKRKRSSSCKATSSFKKRCFKENSVRKSKALKKRETCRNLEDQKVKNKDADFATAKQKRNFYLQNCIKIDKS